MEVSRGQLHAPIAFLPASIEQDAWWAPGQFWTLRKKENLYLYCRLTANPRSPRPQSNITIVFYFFFFLLWLSVRLLTFLHPVTPASWSCSPGFHFERCSAILKHFVFLSIPRFISRTSFPETSFQSSFCVSVVKRPYYMPSPL